MSISSSLAHKYDEFDEFSQPSAPKSAYEELKAWCEKHLDADSYKIIPESKSYCTTIYFNPDMNDNIPCFIFSAEGNYINSDSCTNEEMCEHIEDLEDAPKPDPMPTSIGGQMVRKMIEAYERSMNN